MAEFLKSVVKAARRVVILGLAVALLFKGYSIANASGFDPLWYAEQNPDVVKELGDSPELLELHYEMFGKAECRMSNSTDVEAKLRKLFNAEEYAALYPDVVAAFGNDPDILFEHYVACGILESRKASEDMKPATVASLKKALTDAMESIGAEAVPGSAAVIALMEGTLSEDAAVQDALAQIQDSLVEAVETTIVEANKPEPVEDDSDDDDDEHEHSWTHSDSSPYDGVHTCSICGASERHVWGSNHSCSICGAMTGCNFVNNKCTICGREDNFDSESTGGSGSGTDTGDGNDNTGDGNDNAGEGGSVDNNGGGNGADNTDTDATSETTGEQ